MKQSQLFTKTRREAPSDEVAKNAQLLIQAGYIHKELAGIYSLLPLGFKVVKKIKEIINEEMEKLGSAELIMSTVQNKETWEKTDRWSDEKVDIWFKSKLKNGNEVGFGWSHEEPITEMMKYHISSYKDLPKYVHQFQNKLRNEERAKSGIMRTREFVMKDMYSYCTTEEEHMNFYNKASDAYMNVFNRLGIGDKTYITSASGGVFTDKFSHEFQTLCETGEDTIYVHKSKKIAINEEIFNKETLEKIGEEESDFEKKKSAEVGNIFTFGTEKCEQMGLMFKDSDGNQKPVYLGSYGIGVTRLVGVLVEMFGDDKGIVWPESVAPFKYHLIEIKGKKSSSNRAEEINNKLTEKGEETLFDDREVSAGEKFADADLIGIPYQVIVSERGEAENTVEVKDRRTGEAKVISVEEFLK